MSAYLFTWNPKKWNWIDLEESINLIETKGSFERRWSCGNSKRIIQGDRIFLIRLGEEPKGIFGSGYAKSTYYEYKHWDETPGKTTNYIDITFDVLLNPTQNQILDKDTLDFIDQNSIQQWFPQQSGISIKEEVIFKLEEVWFNFINENGYIKNSFISNDVITNPRKEYIEGKQKEVVQTRYERNPKARKACLEYYGTKCSICTFDFEEKYGEIGKGFIHVHHMNPIANSKGEYILNPIKDLRPVCPNCHAMIHSRRPEYGIEEILERIKSS